MFQISNEDLKRTVRILRSFARTKATTTKGLEERRVARLLASKYERKLDGEKGREKGV